MGPGEFALAVVAAGLGFVGADALDRFLATYNPTAATPPTDKFTSPGTGTLANTLNVGAMPNWKRMAAGVGAAAVPAVGSMFVKNPFARSGLEGMAIGAGVSAFKTLWQNVLMPMLIGKDTSVPTLQKSVIARLYPSEVAAHINKAANQTAVASAGSGALSGAPAGDVGPFALAGSSDYPDAAQVLRRQAGMSDQFPTLQNAWGTGGPGADYPTAAQAMGVGADATAPNQAAVAPPAPGTAIAPNVTAVAPPAPPAAVAATAANIASTIVAAIPAVAPAQAAAAGAAVAVAPPSPAAVQAVLTAALPNVPPATVAAAVQHVHPHVARLHGQSAWQPGPPSVQNPGPQAQPHKECGCVGDEFAGFLGDTLTPEESVFVS